MRETTTWLILAVVWTGLAPTVYGAAPQDSRDDDTGIFLSPMGDTWTDYRSDAGKNDGKNFFLGHAERRAGAANRQNARSFYSPQSRLTTTARSEGLAPGDSTTVSANSSGAAAPTTLLSPQVALLVAAGVLGGMLVVILLVRRSIRVRRAGGATLDPSRAIVHSDAFGRQPDATAGEC